MTNSNCERLRLEIQESIVLNQVLSSMGLIGFPLFPGLIVAHT